ncbi:retrovirus-related Pol polyprotein from transposon 297 [Caerostris darwini]|uniref:Retrovirus-related Pol polyprotein from transposon 297 n=1 Tax=Caerostris darwini TaxID=1538125 RepID=A0AAV4NFM1_9ARAC|nr:retrovirus-related Pol polyprotein from transposon 297 [Caerostris darwini]
MPFGLKNASASFQTLMSIVLAGLSELQINAYIDDVIVASKTVQGHLQKLKIVFQRLTAANLKLQPMPEKEILEGESPSNAELEIPVDVSPTSVQRLPSEEEILKEFPPYTLQLETGNFLEEENYENQGNLVNLSGSGEELSEVPEPVVEIQNGKGELDRIPSESNEH